MNLDRILNSRVPGFDRLEKTADDPPYGHQKITGPEAVRRLRPIVSGVISGQLPLDESTKDALAQVAEAEYRKFKRLSRG